jgi:hypothetical protein
MIHAAVGAGAAATIAAAAVMISTFKYFGGTGETASNFWFLFF